jgi:Na+/H+ antiporter NhaD/arsenite permease-like protein
MCRFSTSYITHGRLLVAFDMHHCHEALHGVEWDTLLFFAALFVVVEGVGELGIHVFLCVFACVCI